MKVLFFVYPSAFQSPGGGEVFLLKTKEALEKKGVAVKLFDQWQDKLKNFDILHVFGSAKECLPLMQTAKHSSIKVALSPIFWSTFQRAIHEFGNPGKKLLTTFRHLAKEVFPYAPSARRSMLTISDMLMPNSEAEARQVTRLFGIPRSKISVVPLGVDEKFASADKREFVNKYGVEDFILSVGRIEPRKNQLNLIRALKNSSRMLILIGDPVTGYEKYYNECRRCAGSNVIFLNRIEHNDPLLASAYAACAIFVLQGWFETPGLAALEAGLAGAKLAVTEQGSTYEYFKDFAEYFNPAKTKSIEQAIEKAGKKNTSEELKNLILKNYLWSNTADATIKTYDKLL